MKLQVCYLSCILGYIVDIMITLSLSYVYPTYILRVSYVYPTCVLCMSCRIVWCSCGVSFVFQQVNLCGYVVCNSVWCIVFSVSLV